MEHYRNLVKVTEKNEDIEMYRKFIETNNFGERMVNLLNLPPEEHLRLQYAWNRASAFKLGYKEDKTA